ncbi:MAG: DUF222 domain-containing protein, partial [Pseudonocardiaceae bacterium]
PYPGCWAVGGVGDPDPGDGPRPHDTLETRRRLTFTGRDGGYELGGWLDRGAAEIVRSALSPLAAPRPTTDTEVDLRDAGQRDADALVELAQRALEGGDLPTEGGGTPAGGGDGDPGGVAGPDRGGVAGAGWPDQRRRRPPDRL